MADAGGVMSIGSPGEGADVWRIGGWSIGTVRAVVWPNSGSLKKGLRCALSSIESIVASPINVSPCWRKSHSRAVRDTKAGMDLLWRENIPHCIQIDSFLSIATSHDEESSLL